MVTAGRSPWQTAGTRTASVLAIKPFGGDEADPQGCTQAPTWLEGGVTKMFSLCVFANAYPFGTLAHKGSGEASRLTQPWLRGMKNFWNWCLDEPCWAGLPAACRRQCEMLPSASSASLQLLRARANHSRGCSAGKRWVLCTWGKPQMKREVTCLNTQSLVTALLLPKRWTG